MALMNRGKLSTISIGMVPSLIFFMLVIMSVTYLISSFVLTDVDTLAVDGVLLTQRLLHSPQGISYVDPITQRVYPHIIDANKLRVGRGEGVDPLDAALREHMYYGLDNTVYAAKFSILGEDYYFNKDRFVRWRPIATKPAIGGKVTSLSIHDMLVFVKTADKLVPGTLHVEVVAQP